MKKFNHLIGTAAVAAALLLIVTACSNSFTPQASGQPQTQNNAQSTQVTLETPLTLEACVDGAVITFNNKAAGPVTYKVNGGTAQTIASGATGTIPLSAIGDKVEFFGDNNTYAAIDYAHYSHIACSADCYIYGNIMSLVKSVGFASETTLEGSYTFCQLFDGDAHIKNKTGSNLLLPATTLTDRCYSGMFNGCSNLTIAPALPAVNLAFYCYSWMFCGCSKLKKTPDLLATTLANSCYVGMFQGCSELSSVTCLASSGSDINMTNWLDGVAATGTFIKAKNSKPWSKGPSGIPIGWTVEYYEMLTPLTLEASEAGAVVTFKNKADGPVTYKVNGGTTQTIASGATENITLTKAGDKVEFFGDNQAYATSYTNYSNIACDKYCYVYGNIMSLAKSSNFESATTLEASYTFAWFFSNTSHIKNKDGAELLLPATTLAVSCYNGMFSRCTSLKAAPSLPATTLEKGCYAHMFEFCSSLLNSPVLPATVLSNSCYDNMFFGCNFSTAPELPATTLAQNCYREMFSVCSYLSTAPVLPATTLEKGCYSAMFWGCDVLSNVTCLATDISAEGCTTNWLDGVAASGTFTKAAGMTGWTTGASGIPSNWTVNDK
ncbi:MAG: hypothetical protein J6X95_09690 [Treponema sp.]|nr:hypothetical protein [Treponema sp.]